MKKSNQKIAVSVLIILAAIAVGYFVIFKTGAHQVKAQAACAAKADETFAEYQKSNNEPEPGLDREQKYRSHYSFATRKCLVEIFDTLTSENQNHAYVSIYDTSKSLAEGELIWSSVDTPTRENDRYIDYAHQKEGALDIPELTKDQFQLAESAYMTQ